MAYNKASEERKWRLWKEAEEKQLRELGVSEDRIAQLRAYDWEIFNSDRRYYEHHADGGDYLEQLAADEEKPDVKTVSDFLDGIDSPVLFSLLSETDPITVLIALRRSQGKSFSEISLEVGLTGGAGPGLPGTAPSYVGLNSPYFFSLCLTSANPPYSIKWEGDENATLINDPRFSPAGVLAPKSKADLAFIMHALSWLATDGTAAIVCFPGVMYRGGAEKKIRKYLIDNNFIDCIIQLPDNLFFGTSIATCIMVLKKSKADNATLFIDASKQCVKVTNSNKLTEENIETILAAFAERTDKEHFARLVPNDEISAQDYNLSVSTYVEQEDTREVIDIVQLNAEIEQIVAREQVLREEISKIVAEIEG